jgi:hypothetical protein
MISGIPVAIKHVFSQFNLMIWLNLDMLKKAFLVELEINRGKVYIEKTFWPEVRL